MVVRRADAGNWITRSFFTRMGQRLIKVLDQPTQDGFVYRVDMRLRPFGESGPLVLSFAALEDYYREQGARLGALRDGQGADYGR